MNPHELYKAIKANSERGSTLPDSLTEYLTSCFNCSQDPNKIFHKLDCITGTCGNQCSVEVNDYTNEKLVTYTIFEKIPTYYYNKMGNEVCYERVARCDKRASIKDIHELLQQSAKNYLLHRYFVTVDKLFWSKFKSQCSYPIIYFDFSENINLIPKHEVQSAHFSGRQTSLLHI